MNLWERIKNLRGVKDVPLAHRHGNLGERAAKKHLDDVVSLVSEVPADRLKPCLSQRSHLADNRLELRG